MLQRGNIRGLGLLLDQHVWRTSNVRLDQRTYHACKDETNQPLPVPTSERRYTAAQLKLIPREGIWETASDVEGDSRNTA